MSRSNYMCISKTVMNQYYYCKVYICDVQAFKNVHDFMYSWNVWPYLCWSTCESWKCLIILYFHFSKTNMNALTVKILSPKFDLWNWNIVNMLQDGCQLLFCKLSSAICYFCQAYLSVLLPPTPIPFFLFIFCLQNMLL